MLKHHPKLKKLWKKAVKRESKMRDFQNNPVEVLDMRYKTSRDFAKAFAEWIKNELKDKEFNRLSKI